MRPGHGGRLGVMEADGSAGRCTNARRARGGRQSTVCPWWEGKRKSAPAGVRLTDLAARGLQGISRSHLCGWRMSASPSRLSIAAGQSGRSCF